MLSRLSGLALLLGIAAPARAEVAPHLSERFLPSSNGLAAIAYDRVEHKITQFLEHPYTAASASATTRNFAFDHYPGVRIGGTGTWLDTVAPIIVEYVPGTGIIHARRVVGTVQLDEYDFAPMGLADHTSIMLLEATNTGATTSAAIDAYALYNFHLGSGAPSPGTDNELVTYDAARDTFYESGPAGVTFAYTSLAPSTHHGCTPNNPFGILNAGGNLADDSGTGGATTDAVPGFQRALGSLVPTGTAWAGWSTALAADSNGAAAADRLHAWVAGRAPAQLLADEISAWHAWETAPPASATPLEAALDLQAQVMLRMGQVAEPGAGGGQILASVAPGMWNIAWVRDMAYAVVGLVRSHHYAEAKAAIAFQLAATVGDYQSYVGFPYQISVVRYYGNGTEWSDSDQNGPNIEFDGFGLFLWELHEYAVASGDTAALATWWPIVKAKVADTLVALQEPSGLVAADSSIWETHWNGQQRHYAYTTITAAAGLCAAADLATTAGDAASSATYLAAGGKARDALLLPSLHAGDGSLVQSTEGLALGTGFLDAATIEAIDLGLVDPRRRIATATLAAIERGLVPQSGRGFIRSNAGDDYSSHEWVFVDLRAARALELHGDAAASADLFAWNVAQASDNFMELSELHDPVSADYAGQAPMVGFGAGAYLISLRDRGTPSAPACGAYVAEPAPSGGDGGTGDGDGGTGGQPGGDGGCCGTGSGGGGGGILGIPLVAWLVRRRRR